MVSRGRRPGDYDLAVLEMGMSSPTHEIRRLVQITPPDIGVELMVAPVHLEHLGTIETVAAMKAELIEGLKPEGIAVLNADDELVMKMKSKTNGPVLTFGIQHAADVTANHIDTSHFGSIRFQLQTPLGQAAAELPMTGGHNLMNALAASAVLSSFDDWCVASRGSAPEALLSAGLVPPPQAARIAERTTRAIRLEESTRIEVWNRSASPRVWGGG
jgi:UDP-N-acetylmuramyl pentapeptide synthase